VGQVSDVSDVPVPGPNNVAGRWFVDGKILDDDLVAVRRARYCRAAPALLAASGVAQARGIGPQANGGFDRDCGARLGYTVPVNL